eukprot:TRINITY_DN27515_c0_g1_i2.p1 TRINITY_DN27515_c0_g1~~TRINITY_DN27515_c0_g1_i2.p1  ORF type:complete len:592 (-),score=97.25 TRINITY_DN27515_c0_g1_i2:42-1817(-)
MPLPHASRGGRRKERKRESERLLCDRLEVLQWLQEHLEPCAVDEAAACSAVEAAMWSAGLRCREAMDPRSVGLLHCCTRRGHHFFRSRGRAMRLCPRSAGEVSSSIQTSEHQTFFTLDLECCAEVEAVRMRRPRWRVLPVWLQEDSAAERLPKRQKHHPRAFSTGRQKVELKQEGQARALPCWDGAAPREAEAMVISSEQSERHASPRTSRRLSRAKRRLELQRTARPLVSQHEAAAVSRTTAAADAGEVCASVGSSPWLRDVAQGGEERSGPSWAVEEHTAGAASSTPPRRLDLQCTSAREVCHSSELDTGSVSDASEGLCDLPLAEGPHSPVAAVEDFVLKAGAESENGACVSQGSNVNELPPWLREVLSDSSMGHQRSSPRLAAKTSDVCSDEQAESADDDRHCYPLSSATSSMSACSSTSTLQSGGFGSDKSPSRRLESPHAAQPFGWRHDAAADAKALPRMPVSTRAAGETCIHSDDVSSSMPTLQSSAFSSDVSVSVSGALELPHTAQTFSWRRDAAASEACVHSDDTGPDDNSCELPPWLREVALLDATSTSPLAGAGSDAAQPMQQSGDEYSPPWLRRIANGF